MVNVTPQLAAEFIPIIRTPPPTLINMYNIERLQMLSRETLPTSGVQFLSTKLGIVMVVLGGMHFFNMFNFDKMRRKGLRPETDPLSHRPSIRPKHFNHGLFG